MNHHAISTVTPPASEPVTLDDLKTFARIDSDDEDTLLAGFITAARVSAEQYTRRSFITQTLKMTLDLGRSAFADSWSAGTYAMPVSALYGSLPEEIKLTHGPVQSVSSIVTYDLSNASAVYDSTNYFVDLPSRRIVLNYGAIWPISLRPTAGCEITYVAGYGAASSVPQPIRTAIMMHAASLYETRGQCGCDEPVDSSKALLKQYRTIGPL